MNPISRCSEKGDGKYERLILGSPTPFNVPIPSYPLDGAPISQDNQVTRFALEERKRGA